MTTVCIDCRYIGQRASGIAEVVQGLIDHVPDLAPDLDFLLLRNPSRTTALSEAGNVREIVVPAAANGPATMWWFSRVADLSGVDLFHATFNIMPAGLKMPCITTVHDIMWLTHPEWCNPRLKGRLEQAFYGLGIKRALRRSAAIATVSEASRNEISAWWPSAADKTFVTLSGVSPDFHPSPEGTAPPAAAGIAQGKRFVLTVGQYAPYKNHEGAIKAFALAFAGRGDIDLVLLQRRGRGTRRLLNLADRLGLAGRVHLPGPMDRSELVQLYSTASVLLHPSFCEGFGNPLAEAMACGCPVVTSDVSAMPEVTGAAALLADPREPVAIAAALRKAVDDPAQARLMREKGLLRASELNWRSFAAANLDLYRRVLAG